MCVSMMPIVDMFLSTAMMLRWLKLDADAQRLEKGLLRVLEEAGTRTPDLGGRASTEEFTDAVAVAARREL